MSSADDRMSIFGRAMELSGQDREAFLDNACAGRPDLRSDVAGLLQSLSDHEQFLADATADGQTAASTATPSEAPGAMIGRYKLLQVIGEGGFGTVYMAEQTHPIVRRVALKVIRLGMDTRQVLARFEAERQALALMDHPNIARVLDAGATEAGRPYFVMELVRGVPVTEFCDANQLSPRDRLKIFMQICSAVQHAHQKGVIHRDIKPSNILVTLHDGEPVPKVIDFGIAKATSARLTARTLFTEFRQFIGTPEYVSPEQAEMSGLDVDTRSDVYSLGVLLYELLTGATPLDSITLRKAGFAELQRMIRESEPAKPSTRVNTLDQQRLSVVAQRRDIDPARLSGLIRGELDWIVMRAMEKDRRRRYDSAAALGEDVRRHLDGEAVFASPPSRVYRLRKIVLRHKGVVAAGAVIVLSLAAGLVATSIFLRQAVIERERARAAGLLAEDQRSRAQSIAQFLQGVLLATSEPANISQFVDPNISPIASDAGMTAARWGGDGPPRSLREVIVNVRRGLDAGAMPDKRLESELRLITLQLLIAQLGNDKENMQAFRDGPKELRKASEVLGQTHPSVLALGMALSEFLTLYGGSEGAPVIRPLYDAARAEFGPGDARTLEIGRQLVNVLRGRDLVNAEGLPLAETLVRASTEAHGKNARVTLACRLALSGAAIGAGDVARAGREAREVLEALGPGVPDTDELVIGALTLSVADVPRIPADRGALLKVAEAQERAYRASRAISGGDARRTFNVATLLVETLAQLRDYPRSVIIMREVADDAERGLQPGFHTTTKSQSRTARLLLWSGGNLDEALRLATQACENGVAVTQNPLGDFEVFDRATVLDIRRAKGEPLAALEGIDTLVRDYQLQWSRTDLSWFGGYLHGVAAQSLEQLGRINEARERWNEAMKEIDAHQEPASLHRTVILSLGTAFFERHGPAEVAARWREQLDTVVAKQ